VHHYLEHLRFNSNGFNFRLISSLTRDRNLEKVQIALTLNASTADFDMTRTRKMLKQLPKMDKLRIDWKSWTSSMKEVVMDDLLIDDGTLLHISSNSNHAVLDKGCFTAEGILRVFEIMCQSPSDKKFVSFATSMVSFDSMIDCPNLKYE
ncbi:hypothetical protein PMAYCL1PPCAC_11570, partial [Pristionchus mayeri]